MATTNPDNIWTPDSGDDYALTTDLAAMADTVQDALTKRANYYVGTTAELAGYAATAPEGASGYDTTLNEEVRLIGGSWVEDDGLVPLAVPDHTTVAHRAGLMVTNTTNGFTYISSGSAWFAVNVRLPYVEFRKTGAQALTNGTDTVVTLDSSPTVISGTWNMSAGVVTFPYTGIVSMSGSIIVSQSGGTYVRAILALNGTAGANWVAHSGATIGGIVTPSQTMRVTAGDNLRLLVQSVGGTGATATPFQSTPTLSLQYLQLL